MVDTSSQGQREYIEEVVNHNRLKILQLDVSKLFHDEKLQNTLRRPRPR